MSGFKEYMQYDATGLAQLVRDKEVTPEEILNAAIDRAETVNPDINAIINPLYSFAQQNLDTSPHQVFGGVPFLLKDLLADVKDVPTSNGSSAYHGIVPGEDSTLVSRYKNAGLNIMGKTNTPELGLMGITEPEAFGASRNPWDLNRSPGGSSGGSAAAVAARIVPMASGGDGGGSIRIPASYCGLFGLKPSRGRNPAGPRNGEHWDGAACEHVLTHSVRDSASLLDLSQGAEAGSPYVISAPEQSYLSALQTPPKKLRIGFSTQSPFGGPVDAECISAIEKSAKLLLDLGHEVEENNPTFDGDTLLDSFLTMYFGHTSAEVSHLKRKMGNKAALKLEDSTRFLALLGDCLSAGDFVSAKQSWFDIAKAMDNYHQRFDLIMTPSTASLAVPIGSLQMNLFKRIQSKLVVGMGASVTRVFKNSMLELANEEARKNLEKTPFTQLANLTGQPAMSVPLHWSAEGLPCGVQFMAPFGDELTLFKLASQLEQAKPWVHNTPEMVKIAL